MLRSYLRKRRSYGHVILIKFTNFALVPFVDYLDGNDLATICLDVSEFAFIFRILMKEQDSRTL